jgi:hypothetical protein
MVVLPIAAPWCDATVNRAVEDSYFAGRLLRQAFLQAETTKPGKPGFVVLDLVQISC